MTLSFYFEFNQCLSKLCFSQNFFFFGGGGGGGEIFKFSRGQALCESTNGVNNFLFNKFSFYIYLFCITML